MNKDWTKFLLSTDAVSAPGGDRSTLDESAPMGADLIFSGDNAPATECICDLSAHALVSVTGEDSESFLQGQFSNDVAKLTPYSSQLLSLIHISEPTRPY